MGYVINFDHVSAVMGFSNHGYAPSSRDL
jgi:hypothetical protein